MQDIILSNAQKSLLRLLQTAGKKSWYLAGGTAIALHLGHRKSIDFDLFKREKFRSAEIDNLLANAGLHWSQKFVQSTEEQTGIIGGVKVTFFTYPFDIAPECEVIFGIHTPTLLTLWAMKAYALGRRAKWKDYVDLYFILQRHTIKEILTQTKRIFAGAFSEVNFREQLSYFDDIDYTEEVEYIGQWPTNETIKGALQNAALTF